MEIAKIVIGSSFGDEGKGYMTDYFANEAKEKNKSCLVVCHNGGSQKGHCQTGDTMILTRYGIKYLEDIVGEKTSKEKTYCVLNMNGEPEETSLLYRQDDIFVNKIILQNGVELKCTDEHKYYVWNSQKCTTEWVKSINLDKDVHQFIFPKNIDNYIGTDNIKINRKFMSTSHNKRKLDIDNLDIDYKLIAEVMGMCNSDGHFKKKGISYIYNLKQPELKTKMIDFCNMFGLKGIVKKKENTDQCEVIDVYSTDLIECLKSIGCHWEIKTNKSTPRFVLEGTKEIIASYIRGLIDTDGSVVSFDLKSKHGKSGKIKFTNTSFKMIKELQQILFVLGINSSIKLSTGKNIKTPKLELQISSFNDLVLYAEKIGFITEYNRNKLLNLIEEKGKTLNKNGNGSKILMNEDLIKHIYALNNKKYYRENQKHICAGMILNSNDVKDNMTELYQLVNNYNFISINEINYKISKETVFDITMPKTHSYLANGTISHNTVVSPSGLRHIFHHFGSGNIAGADTYLSKDFIVNPIIFNKEYEDLKRKGIVTKTFVHKDCLVTTPFDMLINQISETYLGKDRHGSCGLGVNETIIRNNSMNTFTIYDMYKMPNYLTKVLLDIISTYYLMGRLNQLKIESIPTKWVEILSKKDNIIENYIDDLYTMMSRIEIVDDSIFDKYEYVIFEGAQGLLLDQNNMEYFPHLTPSNTGITNPVNMIKDKNVTDIEACYVTRTYMTRHGAGRFDTECSKDEINSNMVDLTNVPNEFQGILRYGKLDLNDLKNRIENDFDSNRNGLNIKKSLAVTHINEYGINEEKVREIFNGYKFYLSDGMTRNSVKVM